MSNVLLPSQMDIKLQQDIVRITDNIPLHNFDIPEFCDTYSEAVSSVSSLHGYIMSNIFIIQCIVSLIITAVSLFKSGIVFLLVFIMSFIVAVFITKQDVKLNFELWQRSNTKQRFNSYISDLFFSNNSNKEIRLFRLSNHFVDEYKKNISSICEDETKVNQPIHKKIGIFFFYQQCVSIMVLIIGLFFVKYKNLPIGNLFSIFTLIISSLGSTNEFRENLEGWQLDTLKMNNAKEFFDKFDHTQSNKNHNTSENKIEVAVPAIDFRGVSFAYLSEQTVLHDVNFSIFKGEVVALIGENGSGKSTLIKLLCGLYKPTYGKVNVVGIDPFDNKNEASEHISTVFQDFARFPLTLRENIAIGSLDDINNDDRIRAVMNEVGLDYLEEKVGGLNKTISKMYNYDGIEISTGEWQKIAIARAYMGNKQIMIFDEPTASLDPISEIKQFQSICNKFRGKTILFTSHRIGLAKMADRIIVLDSGRIVENGSHDTLMKLKGKYYELFQAQGKWYK